MHGPFYSKEQADCLHQLREGAGGPQSGEAVPDVLEFVRQAQQA